MHRFNRYGRSVLGLTACGLIAAACFSDDNKDVLGPQPVGGTNGIFASYVALGNSITAGYQASGITDATQRQSYALLLAQQMNTRYAYASIAGRGCNPPIANFQTQAGPGTITAAQRPTICDLRSATTTDLLTNVAVPNASSFDPLAETGTPFSNILTSLILGGATQVQRALAAQPTFASIWIGNNDVLGFAVRDGRANAATGLAGMTAVGTFQTNYTAMLDALIAGAPGLRGILVGVVQVSNAPIMFPAAAMSNPTFKAGFDAIAGTPTTLDPSCTAAGTGATSLINTFLAFQIRQGAHPPIVACVAGGATGALPAPVGDILILDPAEQTTITARVNAYNAHIQAEADRIGFAYFDPNPTLVSLRTAGTVVTNVPNLASATATFGTGMSLDGVHPGAPIHRTIANELIAAINAEYGTTLAPVP
jgi:lysophospholipase L1-like esterase